MDEQTKIVGIIKNQIIELNEELNLAKIDYANSSLDENDWQRKMNRKEKCKVLEGQVAILNRIEREFIAMFAKQFALA